jgi:predicted AlkP superfamily pyrophosphatase or phosphodiesterase
VVGLGITGRRLSLLALAALLPASSVFAQKKRAPKPPPLVVILVVDQMRSDYITEYGHQWGRGLKRLVEEGAWFHEGAYPYLNTVTCAGHATISTGSFPSTHGMILNGWWDRARGKSVSCTEDALSPVVSYGRPTSGGASARNLSFPTLAEQLREHLGERRVRVVSLSAKARSAIMLAGHSAQVAVWFEANTGSWVTSSAYDSGLEFLPRFLKARPVEQDFGRSWTKLLPESAYLYPDDAPGEHPPISGWTRVFPHALRGLNEHPDATFYAAWRASPFIDEYLAAMAKAAVDELRLGRGRATDLLAVSFSALDVVGHDFGPQSHEVQDVLVRLDVAIGSLLTHLDRTVGKENYVVAFSSDHGVASLPEQYAGTNGGDSGRVSVSEIRRRVEGALQPRLGNGRIVAQALYTDLYFSNGVYNKLRENPAAMDAAIQAIHSVPGVWRVFRGDLLPQRKSSDDPVERAAALSYFPGRSGDLIIVPKPNWFFVPSLGSSQPGGTTHGTLHPYDARVPVILLGRGIKPGKYSGAATPADLAPTLAHLCGFNMPGADGRVLMEALVSTARPSGVAHQPPF